MPALLPFTAFALLFAMLCAQGKEWRVSVLIAATLWGLIVAVTTEALSVVHALALPALVTVWLLVNAVAAWGLSSGKDGLSAYRPPRWRGADQAFVLAAGVIVALVGLTAPSPYPPNTADSMSYHMPRIVHWLHNHTVSFYATHDS